MGGDFAWASGWAGVLLREALGGCWIGVFSLRNMESSLAESADSLRHNVNLGRSMRKKLFCGFERRLMREEKMTRGI